VNTQEVLDFSTNHLASLTGHVFDLLTVSKPVSPDAAVNLAKVVSKLSPLLGNLIEFNAVEYLNGQPEFAGLGQWMRQDPGFPDTIFLGSVLPTPGFEIKAWFPLATEITARFKDSQRHFASDNTRVCLLAWLPDRLIYGKPRILDVVVVSGASVAKARDDHYHNPPDYLVLEPEDTTARTRNLQQTNTNGYKWQGTASQLAEAERIVESWGRSGRAYLPDPAYQLQLRDLIARFPYRLDTNFAKVDRIRHTELEAFKSKVMATAVEGLTVARWARLINNKSDAEIRNELSTRLDITEAEVEQLLE
jgi:hypothetical protein